MSKKEKEEEKEKERNVKKAELKRELMKFQENIALQLKKMKVKIEETEEKLEE